MSYWAYARVSVKKYKMGIKIGDQLKPLINVLNIKGYKDKHIIYNHIFYDQYLGTTMNRPEFNLMMTHIKPYDEIIFYKFIQMGRTLSSACNFIKQCMKNHIQLYIIKGDWYFSSNNKGYKNIYKFFSMVNYYHDMLIEKMNEIRKWDEKNNINKYNGGSRYRFYGSNQKYYIKVYKYSKFHSDKDTAEKFKCSKRTVERIKKSGNLYFYKNSQ